MKTYWTLSVILAMGVMGCASSQKVTEAPPAQQSAKAAPTKAATQTAPSASASSKEEERVECGSGTDTRLINNRTLDQGGCEVQYTKFGSTSAIASSAGDLTHCAAVATRIRTNLENAGFTCK